MIHVVCEYLLDQLCINIPQEASEFQDYPLRRCVDAYKIHGAV